MEVNITSIVEPLPSAQMIKEEENMWRIHLPLSYSSFLQKNNGGVPFERTFLCNRREYAIDRFLSILENTEGNRYGVYDIDVVLSQIEERLTNNEELIGVELLPIVQLFAGDYVCLDFRKDSNHPSVCVWSHEESEELSPTTYYVAKSFDEFLNMLY